MLNRPGCRGQPQRRRRRRGRWAQVEGSHTRPPRWDYSANRERRFKDILMFFYNPISHPNGF